MRLPLSGSKDQGDLVILGYPTITVEVKNHQRMELAQWVDESLVEQTNAGTEFALVVHKRRGKGKAADWYATMTLGQLVDLLNYKPSEH